MPSPEVQPDFRPVALVPTYNNPQTVGEVLTRILQLRSGCPVLAVDDGSTDATAATLNALAKAHPPLTVLRHARNAGKAQALRTGFDWAVQRGHTHAITLDADLQHDPEQIPELLTRARANPEAMVLGERRDHLENMPTRSLIGRRLSNLAIRAECGRWVRDSQSGFRVYPLGLIQRIPAGSGGFSYETEVIVRAVWDGREIAAMPIASRYLPAEQRVSHFRPWRDTIWSLGMHGRMLGVAAGRVLTGKPVRANGSR